MCAQACPFANGHAPMHPEARGRCWCWCWCRCQCWGGVVLVLVLVLVAVPGAVPVPVGDALGGGSGGAGSARRVVARRRWAAWRRWRRRTRMAELGPSSLRRINLQRPSTVIGLLEEPAPQSPR